MKMQHFDYEHLPPYLQGYSKPFHDLAHELVRTLPQCAELNAGLRKLLEAKDCIVRAAVENGTLHHHRSDRMSTAKDPVSGNPLPEGSPYSMAHVPVTPGRVLNHQIDYIHDDVIITFSDGRVERHKGNCVRDQKNHLFFECVGNCLSPRNEVTGE